MSVFVNVNGEIKELYRVFFNDNGVIREIKSFHAQNDNNEIKEVFVRSPYMPRVLEWDTYVDGVSIINNVWNNGYTINGCFTNKKRSASTINKIFLPEKTWISVEISNTEFDTSIEVSTIYVNIYLFTTEPSDINKIASQGSELVTSKRNTLRVLTTGNYYITFSIYGLDNDKNIHYCTTDVDIALKFPD